MKLVPALCTGFALVGAVPAGHGNHVDMPHDMPHDNVPHGNMKHMFKDLMKELQRTVNRTARDEIHFLQHYIVPNVPGAMMEKDVFTLNIPMANVKVNYEPGKFFAKTPLGKESINVDVTDTLAKMKWKQELADDVDESLSWWGDHSVKWLLGFGDHKTKKPDSAMNKFFSSFDLNWSNGKHEKFRLDSDHTVEMDDHGEWAGYDGFLRWAFQNYKGKLKLSEKVGMENGMYTIWQGMTLKENFKMWNEESQKYEAEPAHNKMDYASKTVIEQMEMDAKTAMMTMVMHTEDKSTGETVFHAKVSMQMDNLDSCMMVMDRTDPSDSLWTGFYYNDMGERVQLSEPCLMNLAVSDIQVGPKAWFDQEFNGRNSFSVALTYKSFFDMELVQDMGWLYGMDQPCQIRFWEEMPHMEADNGESWKVCMEWNKELLFELQPMKYLKWEMNLLMKIGQHMYVEYKWMEAQVYKMMEQYSKYPVERAVEHLLMELLYVLPNMDVIINQVSAMNSMMYQKVGHAVCKDPMQHLSEMGYTLSEVSQGWLMQEVKNMLWSKSPEELGEAVMMAKQMDMMSHYMNPMADMNMPMPETMPEDMHNMDDPMHMMNMDDPMHMMHMNHSMPMMPTTDMMPHHNHSQPMPMDLATMTVEEMLMAVKGCCMSTVQEMSMYEAQWMGEIAGGVAHFRNTVLVPFVEHWLAELKSQNMMMMGMSETMMEYHSKMARWNQEFACGFSQMMEYEYMGLGKIEGCMYGDVSPDWKPDNHYDPYHNMTMPEPENSGDMSDMMNMWA